MKLSLYQKLSVTLLSIFLLIVVSFVYVTRALESISRDKAEQALHQSLATHLVGDNPLLKKGIHDSKALENLFHSMMILGPNFEFYVIDPKGHILSYSAKPGEVVRKKIDMQPLLNEYLQGAAFPIYADDPRSDQQKIFSLAPIVENDQVKGYLFVIIGGKIYDSIFAGVRSNESIQVIGVIGATSLLFLLLILLVSFHFFVSPLKQLTQQVNSLRETDFDNELPRIETKTSSGEVEALTLVFNQLIDKVNQQFNLLEKVDGERRELLAHLSHDLRTPLASLQGFLETIQIRRAKLTTDEIERYVGFCLKSAKSINGFVDQIFELAHLESGHVTVTLETFPIAELLYDLKDKLSQKADKKSIQLVIDIADDSLRVTTDIAKLERVLTNLLENALRHTPNKGKIILRAQKADSSQQVIISIQDTGEGIAEEDIPFIFDARYRGDKAVDDDQRHIGLGLTISKKLIALLGSDIRASNHSAGGAIFRFGLPFS
ncbi:MAG: HAMP domain-containing sensor histidine kinase [Enterobacterales bacterium]|nr:HAMP domain-containing sensor histidine kinase [Enterobacterales bacterium]